MKNTEKTLEEILKGYSHEFEIFKPKFIVKHMGYLNDFCLSYENISSPHVIFNINNNIIKFEEIYYKEEKVNKFFIELNQKEITLLNEAIEEDELERGSNFKEIIISFENIELLAIPFEDIVSFETNGYSKRWITNGKEIYPYTGYSSLKLVIKDKEEYKRIKEFRGVCCLNIIYPFYLKDQNEQVWVPWNSTDEYINYFEKITEENNLITIEWNINF